MTNEERDRLWDIFATICDWEKIAEKELADSLGSNSNRDKAIYWNGALETLEDIRMMIEDSGLI